MAIKLDLEKAYDRLRWDFFHETLVYARLPHDLIQLIMNCITKPSMQVLFNGEKTSSFRPTKGIRQGDPLFPTIFVLCVERLAHLIEEAVKKGRWRPVKFSRTGPAISHLFFADDLVLFGEEDLDQMGLSFHGFT